MINSFWNDNLLFDNIKNSQHQIPRQNIEKWIFVQKIHHKFKCCRNWEIKIPLTIGIH